VSKAIDELLQDWLILDDGTGSIHVTECSHDALLVATGKDHIASLEFLKEKGVYHPDMVEEGIEGVTCGSAEEQEAMEAAGMDVMPESGKVKKVEAAQGSEMTVKEVPEEAKRVTSALDMVIADTFKDAKCEFTIAEVAEKAVTISPADLAREIGAWIIQNVEQFIDNQDTVFRMYLCVNSDMGMPASSLYQRLYLSAYNAEEGKNASDDEIGHAVEALNGLLDKAKELLEADRETMEALFRKMVFFYELTGFVVKDGKVQQAMTQKMDGKVSVNVLEFDPVSLTTTVAQGIGKNTDGSIREGDQKVIVKQEEMPAGFGIELEIVMSPKNSVPLAMY